MYKRIFLLCLTASSVISCNQSTRSDETNHIDLTKTTKVKEISISMLNLELETIELETNPKSIFSNVFALDLSSQHILIASYQNARSFNLLLFERNGKFVGSVGRQGKGPGEYQQLTDISFSPNGETIYILDRLAQHLLIFSNHRQHLKTVDVPGHPLLVEAVNNQEVLLAYQKPFVENEKRLIRYNIVNQVIHSNRTLVQTLLNE